jgi:hypothetical protein
MIIQSALMRICDPNRMGAFVAPLNAMQFTMYILVPHIACRLIQQDLKCDMDKAYDVMIKSADVGASLHPVTEDDDDDEFDRLLRANCRAAKNTSYDSDNDDPKATYEIVERAPARVRKAAGVNAVAGPSTKTMEMVPRPKPRQIRRVQIVDFDAIEVGPR